LHGFSMLILDLHPIEVLDVGDVGGLGLFAGHALDP